MTIIPGDVASVVGGQFEVRVRLLDATGNLLPDTYGSAVEWSVEPRTGLAFSPSRGARVLATVSEASTAPYVITASLPGPTIATSAKVNTVKLEQPQSQDWIAVNHAPKSAPTLALVDGNWGGDYKTWELYGFVGGGSLGAVAPCVAPDPVPCGAVTLLAAANGPDRMAANWTATGCDIADRRPTGFAPASCHTALSGQAKPPAVVKVHVWMFAPAATEPAVQGDINYMKRVLSDAWSGLEITPTFHLTGESATPVLDIDRATYDCLPTVQTGLEELGVGTMQAKQVTLVIAQDIMVKSADGEFRSAGIPGYTCPANTSRGAVVLIAWRFATYTTIAHELGHALGPWSASDNWGHTDGIVGMTASNLMHSGHSYAVEAPRSMLTLGQTFRFGLDQNALVNQSSTLPLLRCNQPPTANHPCPIITKDVPR